MDEVPDVLHVIECVFQAHAMFLHQIGDDYGGRARYPGEAVHKDRASLLDRLFDELDAPLEVLFKVCRWGIQDVNELVRH